MTEIELTKHKVAELRALMRKQKGNAAVARRARCVWLAAHGERRLDIRKALDCNDGFVGRWTRAYAERGVAGLVSVYPGRPPKEAPAKRSARVLERTLQRPPPDGSTHWTSRKLAAALGDLSFSTVQRVWRMHAVRPHRLERHMVSNDPDFDAKATDVIGLYLQPPKHAVVFRAGPRNLHSRISGNSAF